MHSSKDTFLRPGSGKMFDPIATRYERVNTILSFGQDYFWRQKAMRAIALKPGERVLDLATGTAQVAISLWKKQPQAYVIGLDPSAGMLQIGFNSIKKQQLSIPLIKGDAEHLPFPNNSLDIVTTSFGIRNFPHKETALQEMARVLKPGGRLVILECAEPQQGVLGTLSRFYLRKIVPWLGGLLSSKKEYRYLQDSIEKFPAPPVFANMIEKTGLVVKQVQPLTFGVCYLYVAEKLLTP